VAKGLSNRRIAEELVISKRTVDAHVEHILAKLKISSRVEIPAQEQREPLEPQDRPDRPEQSVWPSA
jgi:DNA-binding NarL/FixJ family response regulator